MILIFILSVYHTLQGVWKGTSLHPFTVIDLTSRTISPLSSKENTISGSPLVHDLSLISATAFYRHNYSEYMIE